MKLPTRKRRLIIVAAALLTAGIAAFCVCRMNRSAHRLLMTTATLVEINPQKALADIQSINRTFLTERNYMLCDLLKAEALVNMQEYTVSDSLLNFVSPYFKYKADSLQLASIYYYKGEIARHSNFLLEAVEYYTLCARQNNRAYDMREIHFYLNNFKGQVYHIKRMTKEEKLAKLSALALAKELENQKFMEEAYSELTAYYARIDDDNESMPLLKEAAEKGYSGSLQARLLFLLSERYADNHLVDSARIYARQMPRLYQDSIDYLMGMIYLNLQQPDSALHYLERSTQSKNPALCLKAHRRLLRLNVHIGSMPAVSACLERLNYYEEQLDSIGNTENLSRLEDVDKLRKSIRDTENSEVEYYKYWIVYFWIMMAAFVCIFMLLSVSVILRKKKRDLQLKRQQARLDALKMQIDPHFIFNNLSILMDLVETGDTAAPHYIKALAKVYRHIVANVDKNLSSVDDELTCMDSYIYLLKIRFGDTIRVEVQVEDEIRKRQVPPVVLQMLLENAIKHNQASEGSPLLIWVHSGQGKLVVENTLKPIALNTPNHRIGLKNIKERYRLIGAQEPEVYEDEHIYRIVLSTL